MDFAPSVLRQLPLAEAVLRLCQWQCAPEALNELFEQHRGACYTKTLRFATLVSLIGDALLEHEGSGRQSFQRGRRQGELTVSDQAAYQKLSRLPRAVTEAFLALTTQRLVELVPPLRSDDHVLPASVRAFTVITLDGKAIKRVPK